jgi:hypothetical protein
MRDEHGFCHVPKTLSDRGPAAVDTKTAFAFAATSAKTRRFRQANVLNRQAQVPTGLVNTWP